MTNKTKEWIVSLAVITAASAMRAFSEYCFVLPNAFAPGGFTGAATLINYATGFSVGYALFLFNIPVLILAFFVLNRTLAIRSAYCGVTNAAFLVLFDELNAPTYSPEEKLLAAIAGGILSGVALALVLRVGGSFAGTDIIGLAIQRKYSASNAPFYIMAIDSISIIASFFVYKDGLDPVILSLTCTFFCSKVSDLIINNFKSAIKFEIVTNKPREVADALLFRLRHGVTRISAEGMYEGSERSVLVCLVYRRQVTAMRRILKEIDPDAFAYFMPASEVLGQGFRQADGSFRPVRSVPRPIGGTDADEPPATPTDAATAENIEAAKEAEQSAEKTDSRP